MSSVTYPSFQLSQTFPVRPEMQWWQKVWNSEIDVTSTWKLEVDWRIRVCFVSWSSAQDFATYFGFGSNIALETEVAHKRAQKFKHCEDACDTNLSDRSALYESKKQAHPKHRKQVRDLLPVLREIIILKKVFQMWVMSMQAMVINSAKKGLFLLLFGAPGLEEAWLEIFHLALA